MKQKKADRTEPRRCMVCGTLLSIYNNGEECFRHQNGSVFGINMNHQLHHLGIGVGSSRNMGGKSLRADIKYTG